MSLIAGLMSRATPENPSFSLNDPAAWDALGAPESDTGLRVSRKAALGYAAFWRAANIIGNTMIRMPAEVLKRVGKGKDQDKEHPAWSLLRWKANGQTTADVFIKTLTVHALMHRCGYAYILRKNSGEPVELIQLNPEVTFPIQVDRQLWFVTTANGQTRKMPADDVLRIRGLSFDGVEGYSLLDVARETFGMGLAIRKYGAKFFKNGAKPSGVLEHPGKPTPEAMKTLRDDWERLQTGLDNTAKVAVLKEGLKYNPLSMSAKDAQMLEERVFEIREISNISGVPAGLLGDPQSRNHATLEQDTQFFLDQTIDPWAITWEMELRDKLLTEEQKQRDTHVVEFMRRALLRADMAARGAFYQHATGGRAWMAPNEARAAESMNPLEGLDDVKDPTNNFAGNDQPKPKNVPKPKEEEPAPTTDADDEEEEKKKAKDSKRAAAMRPAIEGVVRDSIRRGMKRLAVHVERSAHKATDAKAWIQATEAEHLRSLTEILEPAFALASAAQIRSTAAGDLAGAMITDAAAMVGRWIGTGEERRAAAADAAGRMDAAAIITAWTKRAMPEEQS